MKRLAVCCTVLVGVAFSQAIAEEATKSAKSEVLRSSASQTVVAKLEIPSALKEKGLPPTLWLGMRENKEWYIGYRHAWGEAIVSTKQDLSDRYPVQKLRFRIDGPNGVVGDRTCDNAAECSVDNKYWGTVVGDFSANWHAWACDPNYGCWETTNDW